MIGGENKIKKLFNFLIIIFCTLVFVQPGAVFAVVPPTPIECAGMIFDNTVEGTVNSEILNGTSGRDLIFGMGGSDSINGFAGNDCIVTSAGAASSVNAGNGEDVVVAQGTDLVKGGANDDQLHG